MTAPLNSGNAFFTKYALKSFIFNFGHIFLAVSSDLDKVEYTQTRSKLAHAVLQGVKMQFIEADQTFDQPKMW